MNDNLLVHNIAKNIAGVVFTTNSSAPDTFLDIYWPFTYVDSVTERSDSVLKLSVIEILKTLVRGGHLVYVGTRRVEREQVKAYLYEHEFKIGGKSIYCLTLSQNGVTNGPLNALCDSILSIGVEDGCERCGYSEDGCEGCGYGKARAVLKKLEGVRLFSNYVDVLWGELGVGVTNYFLEVGKFLREKTVFMKNKMEQAINGFNETKFDEIMGVNEEEEEEDLDDDNEEDDEDELEEEEEEEEYRPELNFVVDEEEVSKMLFGDD